MRIGSSYQKGSTRLDGGRDPDRRRMAPERVQLNHDVHGVAHRAAYLAERLQRPVEVARGDIVAVGLDRSMVERPDLHAGDALLQQAERQLVGAVEEGVEVLVGAFVRAFQPPVVRAPVRAAAHIAVAGAGVVGADAVPAEAAEKLVDRLPRRLAEQVPERDVHGRPTPRLGACAGKSDIRSEVPPNALDGAGVAPEQLRRRGLVQIGLDRAGPEKGLAEARQPLVGMHPHPEHIGGTRRALWFRAP